MDRNAAAFERLMLIAREPASLMVQYWATPLLIARLLFGGEVL